MVTAFAILAMFEPECRYILRETVKCSHRPPECQCNEINEWCSRFSQHWTSSWSESLLSQNIMIAIKWVLYYDNDDYQDAQNPVCGQKLQVWGM